MLDHAYEPKALSDLVQGSDFRLNKVDANNKHQLQQPTTQNQPNNDKICYIVLILLCRMLVKNQNEALVARQGLRKSFQRSSIVSNMRFERYASNLVGLKRYLAFVGIKGTTSRE